MERRALQTRRPKDRPAFDRIAMTCGLTGFDRGAARTKPVPQE